jgi:hypothetical protein
MVFSSPETAVINHAPPIIVGGGNGDSSAKRPFCIVLRPVFSKVAESENNITVFPIDTTGIALRDTGGAKRKTSSFPWPKKENTCPGTSTSGLLLIEKVYTGTVGAPDSVSR